MLSILKKDIVSKMRKDPNYVGRMKMRVLDGSGNEIDAKSVDWQSDRTGDLARTLGEAGMVVLERAHTILPIKGVSVGIAAVKGFVGGFDYGWANFGEPLFREAYTETTRDVEALERGLRAIAGCGLRIALLHFAPVKDTLGAERHEIYPFLGSYLLAEAIDQAGANLIIHGHAHRGVEHGVTPAGIPVRNVALPVIRQAFKLYSLP